MYFESNSEQSDSDQDLEKDEHMVNMHFCKITQLYETHQVSVTKFKNLIPNFAGGSLPRCDRGDREYYCTTMLTLFKPWETQ